MPLHRISLRPSPLYFSAALRLLHQSSLPSQGWFLSAAQGSYARPFFLLSNAAPSVKLCQVSKEGLQHMLFCRVIVGNKEEAQGGTCQSYPSNRSYDLGVDNAFNRKRYLFLSKHLHILSEYIVRFELNPQYHAYLNGLKDGRVDMEHNKVLHELPRSLEPLVLLYERLHERLTSYARRFYLHYFEELKRKEITREDLTMKMSSVIQELSRDPKMPTTIVQDLERNGA